VVLAPAVAKLVPGPAAVELAETRMAWVDRALADRALVGQALVAQVLVGQALVAQVLVGQVLVDQALVDRVLAAPESEGQVLEAVYRAERMRPEQEVLVSLAKLLASLERFLAPGREVLVAAQVVVAAADRGTEQARAPDRAKMKSMEFWVR
jgi:hypothetical protein